MRTFVLSVALALASSAVAMEAVRVQLDAPRGRLRIAALGDLHGVASEELITALVAEHRRDAFDALLVLGDNFETGVLSAEDPLWADVVENLSRVGVPLYPVLGNHDYGNPKRRFGRIRIEGPTDPDAQIAFRRGGWTFPGRNYVIVSPIAEIVMIDSLPLAMNLNRPILGSSTAAEVMGFVRSELARPFNGWRIIAGHHNVEQSGRTRLRSRNTRRHMTRFGAAIDDLGADLYLSGHQHHMELYRFGGTTHLISGLAGPRPKHPRRLQPHHGNVEFVTTVERSSAAFAVLDIRPDVLRVTFHDGQDSFAEHQYAVVPRHSATPEELGGG